MKETYEKMIPWVFADEGEYSNDPDDDGGPTRLGITYIDLARHRGISQKKAWPLVKGMDEDEVKAIYRRYYWEPCSCDSLPLGLDYFTFDGGLLSGIGVAPQWVQREVGVKADGHIGPVTLSAIAAYGDPRKLLDAVETRRRTYLKSLAKWSIYKRGWTNRVNKAKARAVKLMDQK